MEARFGGDTYRVARLFGKVRDQLGTDAVRWEGEDAPGLFVIPMADGYQLARPHLVRWFAKGSKYPHAGTTNRRDGLSAASENAHGPKPLIKTHAAQPPLIAPGRNQG